MNFIEMDTKEGLVKMIIPMILVMFLDLTYNLVDSFWVGNLLGKVDYAALTNATPIILFLVAVSLGGTNGISIIVSQFIGAREKEKTISAIATGFIISIIIGMGIIIGLEVFLNEILKVINVPIKTFFLTDGYLKIYIIGYLPTYLYLFFISILRSFGDMNFQIIPMIISIILNIFLDPIFIRIFGFNGVAIATVLSQIIAVGIIIIYIMKKNKFRIALIKANKEIGKILVRKMIPSIIQECLPAVSTIFFTGFISSYGIIALDAYGVISGIERFVLYPAMALNMVLTVIMGQCFGGGRKDRGRDYLKIAIKYGGIVIAILIFIMIAFSKEITEIFIKGNNISEIVRNYFIIVGLGYVCNYISNCFLGTLNGVGKPEKGMIIKVIYYLVIRIPLAYIFSSILGMGLNGIWIAILISHITSVLLSSIYSRRSFIEK